MYIRYIVFTKYIRFIYLLETIDMSVVQKFTTLLCSLWTKYICVLLQLVLYKLTKDCLQRSSFIQRKNIHVTQNFVMNIFL